MEPVRTVRRRRLGLKVLVGALVALTALAGTATARHLEIPAPTGDRLVGRSSLLLIDVGRPEARTSDPTDHRAVPVRFWYPAIAGTGLVGDYIENLDALAPALLASGTVSSLEVWGLRHVRHHARDGADIDSPTEGLPVVLLSPGNQTNVVFYSALAEDLASQGHVVVGVDHPFQVAAVELADGKVAGYDPAGDAPGTVGARIDERVADLQFVVDELARRSADVLDGALDLTRLAAVGHSNGGLAAVEFCRRSAAASACVNLDGQAAGGPFSTDEDGGAPGQPFLHLTKETELHPEIERRFEAGGSGTYRVVLPAAAHDDFADGALFRPGLNPFERRVDRVVADVRAVLASFLDDHLLGRAEAMQNLQIATEVYVNVYPLNGRPSLPAT